jgi:hypothetical protein
MSYRFKREKSASVHFIPDLMVGVFVTLRAPEVIKLIDFRRSQKSFSLHYFGDDKSPLPAVKRSSSPVCVLGHYFLIAFSNLEAVVPMA